MKFDIDSQLTARIREDAGVEIARVAALLDERHVSHHAISESLENGQNALRFTSSEGARAQSLLAELGYDVALEPVLAIPFRERRGILAVAAKALARCGVSIDYIYPSFDAARGEARVILKVSNIPLASRVLQQIETAA